MSAVGVPGGLGSMLIAAERQRQVDVEGFGVDHDDQHEAGEMLVAARSYIDAALNLNPDNTVEYEVPSYDWPWHADWWKPSDDPIRDLVKAGALIAAEIDRLTRSGG